MRKAILVPSDIGQQVKPVDFTLNNLDSEMMRILEAGDLPVDVKLSQYNQVLQRHRSLLSSRNQPYKITVEEKDDTLKDVDVLSGIPETKLPTAKLLLDFIHKQRNITISDNGEVIINGNHIKGSNIVDLIHDLSRDRKTRPPPIGANPLLDALKTANIPLEYIGNKNRLIFVAPALSPLYHTPAARRFERLSAEWNENNSL